MVGMHKKCAKSERNVPMKAPEKELVSTGIWPVHGDMSGGSSTTPPAETKRAGAASCAARPSNTPEP